jgi:hypothetical protein
MKAKIEERSYLLLLFVRNNEVKSIFNKFRTECDTQKMKGLG